MSKKKKTIKRYNYNLKLDPHLEAPLKGKAGQNRRTINEELNVAVENHVNPEGSK